MSYYDDDFDLAAAQADLIEQRPDLREFATMVVADSPETFAATVNELETRLAARDGAAQPDVAPAPPRTPQPTSSPEAAEAEARRIREAKDWQNNTASSRMSAFIANGLTESGTAPPPPSAPHKGRA